MHTDDAAYNEQIIEKLLKSPLLRSLHHEDVRDLLRRSKIVEYRSGDQILGEGKDDTRLYYLVSGKVSVVKEGITLSTIEERGSIFGEMAGIDGSVRSASVFAANDTMCLVLDVGDIDELGEANKAEMKYRIYRKFSEILAIRLRFSTEKLVGTTKKLSEAKSELAVLKKEKNGI